MVLVVSRNPTLWLFEWAMMLREMGELSEPSPTSRPQGTGDRCDPWRKQMRRAADQLRLLDEPRFKRQIARIEECLRRDAAWDLEAALTSCHRWHTYPSC